MIKIIFLLFALINSKLEFTPHLGNLKVLLDNNYASGFLDEKLNCTGETEDQCVAESVPDEYYQCCYKEYPFMEDILGSCGKYLKDMNELKNLYNSKQYRAFEKEDLGYITYVENGGEIQRKEENLTCSNGQINFVEDGEFNENDQKKLKNENHCLNKFESKYSNYSYDVGKCEEGLLTDNAKKAGLECGYMVFKIKINSEKTINYKLCYPFELEFQYETVKLEHQYYPFHAKNFIKNYGYDNYESFTFEIYNTKGQKVKYDSKTDKIITENAGSILSASIYLFLLILILF